MVLEAAQWIALSLFVSAIFVTVALRRIARAIEDHEPYKNHES
jgi:hypothetical protein